MILNINAEDSAVTLVLVGHGEDLEIFAVPALTNWNPGRIFFVCKQSSVSGHPDLLILIPRSFTTKNRKQRVPQTNSGKVGTNMNRC